LEAIVASDSILMRFIRISLVLSLAVASTACFGLDDLLGKSPTSPSTDSDSVRSYLGTWSGPPTTSFANAQSCGAVQWKITSQAGTQISGEFGASCSGGVTLAGTVVGSHGETVIPWAASGTATQGATSCPFNMTGTGTFQGTSNILVNYAGSSCLGAVSGSETIKR
jgi:hypothetical protein